MCTIGGECFIVRKPYTNDAMASVIFGRNSLQPAAMEVQYFPKDFVAKQKCQLIEIDGQHSESVILNRSAGVWGGESGSNDKNVVIAITWSENPPIIGDEQSICATDLVRLGLERASSSAEAVDIMGRLIEEYSTMNDAKFCFIICDPNDIWLLNAVGKIWAAELVTDGYRCVPLGLTINSKIDKSSTDMKQTVLDRSLWNGNGELNFSKVFDNNTFTKWPGQLPSDNGDFGLTNMFELLRSVSLSSTVRPSTTSQVSMLRCDNGLSSHWFTATPNPCESVFKPFIFTANVRISPLTKINPTGGSSDEDSSTTQLHRLHGQRDWQAVGKLLKSLESTCVDEVMHAICENQVPNQEFDELLKDCVEAEVKFYR